MGQVASSASERAEVGAFGAFFDDHYRQVVALILAMTGDRETAMDVAQEALTRAYQRWERVGRYDDPGAWVRRVAWNLAVSRWRRLRREAGAVVRLGAELRTDEVALPDGSEAVWQEVRRLRPREAVAIHLHYAEDRSLKEIAAVLDCSEGAARTLLYRARKRLAERLGEEWR